MRKVLERLAKGEISVEEAELLIRLVAVEQVGEMARLDVGREDRKGVPEIILAEGKTPEALAEIARKVLVERGRVILSRLTKEHIDVIRKAVPSNALLDLNERGRVVVIRERDFAIQKSGGKVGILTAGTSDITVAEEAKTVAFEMGCETFTAYDVGVAGIHRVFLALKEMLERNADALVVVAGMEGALPGVIAGLVDIPVIAVPTSTGYGLGEKGLGALMAMLQSCSLGLAVVNIDNGVAAGSLAALIANRAASRRRTVS